MLPKPYMAAPSVVTRSAWFSIAAFSTASLIPLIVNAALFHRLFFFDDDWGLLDGATQSGLGSWLAQPFVGESIFPLFKLAWLGAVHLTGGDYFGLILLLWATHFGICLLYGLLLARFGLPRAGIAFALLTFGLAWSNIETLGWSTQWNAQLAIVFFLAAWHVLPEKFEFGWAVAASFLCILASGLCSARGVASGLVLAVFALLRSRRGSRLRLCLLCLSPPMVLVAAQLVLATRHVFAPLPAAAYAAYSAALNPLFLLLPFRHAQISIGALIICAAIKTLVYTAALRKAERPLVPLLWTLIAFDLIFAASLGYSRWTTGLSTTVSSRYQYIPLLCFGPMAGLLIARLRTAPKVVLIVVCACAIAYPWKRKAEQWSTWRGTRQRAAISEAGPLERFDPSPLTAEQARELTRLYHLH